jgi:hypothetical protein
VEDVLLAKLVSPAYTALSRWRVGDNVFTVRLAVPPETLAVPNVEVPSLNVTAPVILPPAPELTVAFRVTGWP